MLTLEVSEQLLRLLGSVLDIRQVFPEISAIVQPVIPHDRLTMTLHDGQRSLVAHAFSNDDGPFLVRIHGTHIEALQDGWFRIVDDISTMTDPPWTDVEPKDYRTQLSDAGYRSVMSVIVRGRHQRIALHFWSKQAAAFSDADVPAARLIALHLALGVSHEQLAEAAEEARAARRRAQKLAQRVEALSEALDSHRGVTRMAGTSAEWRRVVTAATQVAATETTVLLTGESGTGKEVISRYIHRASTRRHGPFVAVNCAALPEPLLESELFGHERGAFTGAQQRKPGQIDVAAGGVLLLDEVSEMALSAQVKLLRVLQEREFTRLGGTRPVKADIRLIAATNRDLRAAVERGDFRDDLYYRLQVFGIHLPPLRERPEDIVALTAQFLEDLGQQFGRAPAGITYDAKAALLAHPWRGNARELRNALERAAILAEGGLITPEHLALEPLARTDAATTTDVREMERQLITRVLREARGNKSRAARKLGLSRKQLYHRIGMYGIG
ncbi:Transcriptional regulatory protein ZraR [Luteitalea pratensis]|uniref:Transcriptional regulatory protein ZraR n=1 Tax=Luteitalea pratensis TaxID=1855912 RepID=A0A143PK11_LUTPR|nr:sigma 54-interacting transcriptional regulator [Luteitalea pratensis]AMY08590.1 Transcriptional regulatory protein ZraR [Luteitalea pratensis]